MAGIIFTDEAFRRAALAISSFDEDADCSFKGCFNEILLTEYTESHLKKIDPKLILLAPFTVTIKEGKSGLLARSRKWKETVSLAYPAEQVRDALGVMGLFILNRFRDVSREEVIAMLNFDLMDTVAGRQIFEEGLEKGEIKGEKNDLEKGIIAEAREMVIEALSERFVAVPDKVIQIVNFIERRDILKELHRLAIRSQSMEEFQNALEKVSKI